MAILSPQLSELALLLSIAVRERDRLLLQAILRELGGFTIPNAKWAINQAKADLNEKAIQWLDSSMREILDQEETPVEESFEEIAVTFLESEADAIAEFASAQNCQPSEFIRNAVRLYLAYLSIQI